MYCENISSLKRSKQVFHFNTCICLICLLLFWKQDHRSPFGSKILLRDKTKSKYHIGIIAFTDAAPDDLHIVNYTCLLYMQHSASNIHVQCIYPNECGYT